MIVKSNYSATTIELSVQEALEQIRQLTTAVSRALANGSGSYCEGVTSERTDTGVTNDTVRQSPGVLNVVVRRG
jgi:hypothetical protein